MATRRTVSLESALAWLADNEPARAKTYDAASQTVQVMRKTYTRRKDGTIVGYHDDRAAGRWERTRRDVCQWVASRIAQNERRERNRQIVAHDIAETAKHAAALESELAGLQGMDLASLPAVARDAVTWRINNLQTQIAKLQR